MREQRIEEEAKNCCCAQYLWIDSMVNRRSPNTVPPSIFLLFRIECIPSPTYRALDRVPSRLPMPTHAATVFLVSFVFTSPFLIARNAKKETSANALTHIDCCYLYFSFRMHKSCTPLPPPTTTSWWASKTAGRKMTLMCAAPLYIRIHNSHSDSIEHGARSDSNNSFFFFLSRVEPKSNTEQWSHSNRILNTQTEWQRRREKSKRKQMRQNKRHWSHRDTIRVIGICNDNE